MFGDSHALALRAGAALIDMECVQFFPIGHLAPRLVGMDPIMWDPFRYKLGGKLLNGNGQQFIENYGGVDGEQYTVGRDLASYAIIHEVRAGRALQMVEFGLVLNICLQQILEAHSGR